MKKAKVNVILWFVKSLLLIDIFAEVAKVSAEAPTNLGKTNAEEVQRQDLLLCSHLSIFFAVVKKT